jgi:hypothetical protein
MDYQIRNLKMRTIAYGIMNRENLKKDEPKTL